MKHIATLNLINDNTTKTKIALVNSFDGCTTRINDMGIDEVEMCVIGKENGERADLFAAIANSEYVDMITSISVCTVQSSAVR